MSFIALLIIVFIALLVVRLGTIALMLSGMSLSTAKFQAASAFFGVGFTTNEAEMVVDHPVRRNIILHLIIAGNIGITSALATLIVTFVTQEESSRGGVFTLVSFVLLGVIAIYILAHTSFIRTPLDRLIRFTLERAGVVRAQDYELLLNVRKGFCVSDFTIEKSHPFTDKALHESRPNDQGIVILGVTRKNGKFVGTPNKNEVLKAGDTIMVYGSEEAIGKMATVEDEKNS